MNYQAIVEILSVLAFSLIMAALLGGFAAAIVGTLYLLGVIDV